MDAWTPVGARLLPWVGEGGKPCYVIGEGAGRVSRLADGIESVQLGMAKQLLEHADEMLHDPREVTRDQLGYVTRCLTASLRDVHRIAESRGSRLAAVADGMRDEPSPGTEPPVR